MAAHDAVPPVRKHRIAPAIGLFIVTFFATLAGLEALELPPAGRLVLALLPVASLVWVIYEEIRLIRGLDELGQRIQLEALAVAYPTALLLLFGFGLLERAGFAVPAFERVRDVWALAVIPYALGLLLARGRYR
jgi:hypothetical protein